MGIRIWPRERATNECALDLLTAEESAEVPIGMDLIIGVESVLRSKRTKAARKIMDRGVAGRRSPMIETMRSSFGTEGLLSGLSAEVRSWRGGCGRRGCCARAHMVWKDRHALRSAMELRLFVPDCIRYAVYFADGR
ncbi:hypothetical protein KC348_g45 [Hortaea werneckii]|nr:hypothetical protein KC348_g45 [Hortaea werneckii]